jgi:ribosomal protein L3 glutamine methyltransferase
MPIAPTPLRSVRDLLRYGVSRFCAAGLTFGHGSSNAYDEAAYLVLHALHLPLDMLEPFLDARLLDDEISRVLDLLERRVAERLPAPYLTGEAWMHGYRFQVDERVLVPRSFIGELLRDGLAPWVDAETVGSVLELCTGSGCLAIMAADAFPHARIDATDISAGALEVARRNVDEYQLGARIALHEGDLYAALAPQRYDVILSNPPYVNAASMDALPAEYRHEPPLALAGGVDGMDIVRRIVQDAQRWLKPDGVLVVEIGNEHAHAEAAFGALDLTWLSTSAGDDAVFLLRAADLPPSTR